MRHLHYVRRRNGGGGAMRFIGRLRPMHWPAVGIGLIRRASVSRQRAWAVLSPPSPQQAAERGVVEPGQHGAQGSPLAGMRGI